MANVIFKTKDSGEIKTTDTTKEILLLQITLYFNTDKEKNMALIGTYVFKNRSDFEKTLLSEFGCLEETLKEYVKNNNSTVINKRFESLLRYVSEKDIINKYDPDAQDIRGLAIISKENGEILKYFEDANDGLEYVSQGNMNEENEYFETFGYKTFEE